MRSLIADLGDAYCEELRRTRDRVVSTSPTPIPSGSSASTRRSGSCPRCVWTPSGPGERGTDASVPGDAGGAQVVRLTDDDGLIALAEPRPGGMLAPIVGLRG